MDKYFIDFSKIMYHPDRLSQWKNGLNNWEVAKRVYPIYVEVTTSGACNHRCKFCALDYLGYNTGMADTKNLKKAITDMAKGGVKSIQFGGEGEPFLHPKMGEIVQHTKACGIDISFTTNGTLMRKDVLKTIIPLTTWIKVSIDAGTPETHMKIHRPKTQDFDNLIENLKDAVAIRRATKSSCALGAQLLLLPDNYHEALGLAKLVKDIGLDYLVIKPYSQHQKSITKEYDNVDYKKYFYLADKLEKLNSDNFKVIFRKQTMERLDNSERGYKVCHAVPFMWAYLMANGDIYTCSSFLGDKEFRLGNYNKDSFKNIWESDKRKKHWKFIRTKFDIKHCRENCRMDEVNRYLEKLSEPPEHVNFI